jgi:hypothetical protein
MQMSAGLGTEQQLKYRQRGYCFPIRVFDEGEAAELLRYLLDYMERNRERWEPVLPRDRRALLQETHLFLRWVYRMVSHPKVLDAVETVLGPNLLVWSSGWFPKMPRDNTYVSWHQDATYWGLRPPSVTTAWIALFESTPENGCMRVVPDTHKNPLLPQRETYAHDNMLSRGQEIAVEVNEAEAVDIILRPGEMSLHHIGLVHGSRMNTSEKPRIGLAVRYITPDVIQGGSERDLVLLVRGKDEFGHFDLAEPPQVDENCGESAVQAEALRRKGKNILPKDYVGPNAAA